LFSGTLLRSPINLGLHRGNHRIQLGLVGFVFNIDAGFFRNNASNHAQKNFRLFSNDFVNDFEAVLLPLGVEVVNELLADLFLTPGRRPKGFGEGPPLVHLGLTVTGAPSNFLSPGSVGPLIFLDITSLRS
jgi:hypothetical protein